MEVKTKIKDLVEPEYELKTKVLKHMGYVEGEDGSDWIEKSKESIWSNPTPQGHWIKYSKKIRPEMQEKALGFS